MQAPSTSHPGSAIDIPAVSVPHQGTSYNPLADAHQDLLRAAHEVEEEEMKGVDKGRDVHERIMQARRLGDDFTQRGLPSGMTLHKVEEEEEEEPPTSLVKPAPARKTKQQRKKARRVLAEVRLSLSCRGANHAIPFNL